ncbi:unnamed protein product [marine sediment metagenome]|uniref:Phosphoadenosine phosphosulphate reductase domain-containing protein n=1 Tax=marine sediment metagenome TaxID=412755 RepID=X0USK8_9ZZZZ
MKAYLSYGGGVNSTACIVLHAQGKLDYDEAIYVDHGCDWPETRKYVKELADRFPITILKTDETLYEYSWRYEMIPATLIRWCTKRFKVDVLKKYVKRPCFQLIGFACDEAHRANLKTDRGIENRFPLIEREVDRKGCKKIISDFGLSVPIKSGCYFCPFQRINQWKSLRRLHPDLFCKAEQLERRNQLYRKRIGKKPMYLYSNKKPLKTVVREKEDHLFDDMKYPPCNCEL